MTKLLEQAFDEVSKLSATEQDAIADWLLKELESERKWDESLSRSPDALSKLADEAREELRSGRTEDLIPDEI